MNKHIKLYEAFVNESKIDEKAYQMTGTYGAKGIPGKVLFAFKKQVEKIKFEGDTDETLKELNKVWSKWAPKEGAEIIKQEVLKQAKDKEAIAFVTASLGQEWEADTRNGINREGSSELFVTVPTDFVINIGFVDGAEASNFSRRLGGMTNEPLKSKGDVDVIGSFDSKVGTNNVEIRDSLFLSIDAK